MAKKMNVRLSLKEVCAIKHALQLQVKARQGILERGAACNSDQLLKDIESESKLIEVFVRLEYDWRIKFSIPKPGQSSENFEQYMRHDSYRREGGAIRQTRWSR